MAKNEFRGHYIFYCCSSLSNANVNEKVGKDGAFNTVETRALLRRHLYKMVARNVTGGQPSTFPHFLCFVEGYGIESREEIEGSAVGLRGRIRYLPRTAVEKLNEKKIAHAKTPKKPGTPSIAPPPIARPNESVIVVLGTRGYLAQFADLLLERHSSLADDAWRIIIEIAGLNVGEMVHFDRIHREIYYGYADLAWHFGKGEGRRQARIDKLRFADLIELIRQQEEN